MSEVEKTGVTTELPHSLNQSPEPGGGRSRLRGVPYSGGPPKRRRTPLGRRHEIQKMQPERSPDADEWVSQRVREREGTHEEAPASARAARQISAFPGWLRSPAAHRTRLR